MTFWEIDFLRKVVFMEVAGEDIHGFLAPQHTIHHAAWIHPVIKDQDRLLRFKHKPAMVDICQFHVVRVPFFNSYLNA